MRVGILTLPESYTQRISALAFCTHLIRIMKVCKRNGPDFFCNAIQTMIVCQLGFLRHTAAHAPSRARFGPHHLSIVKGVGTSSTSFQIFSLNFDHVNTWSLGTLPASNSPWPRHFSSRCNVAILIDSNLRTGQHIDTRVAGVWHVLPAQIRTQNYISRLIQVVDTTGDRATRLHIAETMGY